MPRDHHDDHFPDDNEVAPLAARTTALGTNLVQKGMVDPAAIGALIETCETRVGPSNRARVAGQVWPLPPS